jgi:two-component system sensor histidine kinase CreC
MAEPAPARAPSLRLRLVLLVLAAAALSAAAVAWQGARQLRMRYQEAMEEALVDTANLLAALAEAELESGGDPARTLGRRMESTLARRFSARIHGLVKEQVAFHVVLTDAHGRVLVDTAMPVNVGADYSRWNDIARTIQGRYGARATRADPADERSAVLYVAAPVRQGGALAGVVSVSKPVDAVTPFVAAGHAQFAAAAAVALLAVGAAALAASWWFTRPLRQLLDHVRAVRAGSREPAPCLGGELGELAAAVAGLRAALDGRAYVERYVQTLTHEMKGPLAAVRAAGEILADDPAPDDRARFCATLQAEVERLQGMIDRLLQLAALERRDALAGQQSVDIAALCADVAASLEAAARRQGVTVAVVAAGAGLAVRGEAFLLRQALANLALNALAAAPAGSVVDLAARSEGGEVVLTVADRGAGIPEWARERVFERFFSLPDPRSGRKGTGLGLPLVREVAAVHRGSVALRPRDGGGTCAELRLPA